MESLLDNFISSVTCLYRMHNKRARCIKNNNSQLSFLFHSKNRPEETFEMIVFVYHKRSQISLL